MTGPVRAYLLHYAPDNASLVVRLALEELRQPCRTALVDRATRQQDRAAYRALNPAGPIPVPKTPDGPIFETAAILLWLSKRPGAPEAVPAFAAATRARVAAEAEGLGHAIFTRPSHACPPEGSAT